MEGWLEFGACMIAFYLSVLACLWWMARRSYQPDDPEPDPPWAAELLAVEYVVGPREVEWPVYEIGGEG